MPTLQLTYPPSSTEFLSACKTGKGFILPNPVDTTVISQIIRKPLILLHYYHCNLIPIYQNLQNIKNFTQVLIIYE